MNTTMRTVLLIVACTAMGRGAALFAQAPAVAGGEVPATLTAYAQAVLVEVGRKALVAQYLEAQNARPQRVSDLKALDRRWVEATGVESYMWDLMRNRLAWELYDFQVRHPFVTETFAMDRRGAIVAETNRTSSFYKGEAEKFTSAYAGGAGAVWFGPAGYDDSTGEMAIQVSVPVMKGASAIGVICFTISLDRWEERKTE
jgi:hypothetical protein